MINVITVIHEKSNIQSYNIQAIYNAIARNQTLKSGYLYDCFTTAHFMLVYSPSVCHFFQFFPVSELPSPLPDHSSSPRTREW